MGAERDIHDIVKNVHRNDNAFHGGTFQCIVALHCNGDKTYEGGGERVRDSEPDGTNAQETDLHYKLHVVVVFSKLCMLEDGRAECVPGVSIDRHP